MARYGDPERAVFARLSKAYRVRLARYLTGRPVIQVKDLWAEAGLGADRYADNVYMEARHAERLLDIGYQPVVVPAMSGAANVLILVRKPWPVDTRAGAINPRFLPYLEDGDPLMALLVGRAQREMELAGLSQRKAAMAGLDDFARRMSRISVEVEGNVEQAVKDCAVAVTRSVISNTPVDTGRARSNWTAQLDAAFAALFPARVPGEKGSTGEANAVVAVEAAEQVIETFDIERNGSIHITNNLPYIGALNDGHSKQAPADFVKLAVMDGLATVRNAKILKD